MRWTALLPLCRGQKGIGACLEDLLGRSIAVQTCVVQPDLRHPVKNVFEKAAARLSAQVSAHAFAFGSKCLGDRGDVVLARPGLDQCLTDL